MRIYRPVANSDIVKLHKKGERGFGLVSEEDLKSVLKRYRLRDGLITIGRASSHIYHSNDPNIIDHFIYRDPRTGILVSQFELAYLANLLLISGSNDYKAKTIAESGKDNLLVLCNTYGVCLIQPELQESHTLNLSSLMVRMDFEQMKYQFYPPYLISRTKILYEDLANRCSPQKFKKLPDIFSEQTGLTIHDYLLIALAVLAGAKATATFSVRTLTDADIPHLKQVLTEKNLNRFLRILKADYKTFREQDAFFNKGLDSVFTKTRFNPLLIWPIIETQVKAQGDDFVIPNFAAYALKAFGGIYWWFHRSFEATGEHRSFREYFGKLFQEYVGRILEGIYGVENVHAEIAYGKDKKFIDWWVNKGETIYLFEAKAYQFALTSWQTAEEGLMEKEVRKIADAITQVYKRIQEIPAYPELKHFEGKKIITFIVFLDMPFVSSPFFAPLIKNGLEKVEKGQQLAGLKDALIFLLNIKELEVYDEASMELEDVFPAYQNSRSEGLTSILRRAKGGPLRNRLLDKVYADFSISVLSDLSRKF